MGFNSLARDERKVSEEMKHSRGEFTPTFDYLLREVSAETGEGVNEAFEDFINFLFQFQSQKKKRIKVSGPNRSMKEKLGSPSWSSAKKTSP